MKRADQTISKTFDGQTMATAAFSSSPSFPMNNASDKQRWVVCPGALQTPFSAAGASPGQIMSVPGRNVAKNEKTENDNPTPSKAGGEHESLLGSLLADIVLWGPIGELLGDAAADAGGMVADATEALQNAGAKGLDLGKMTEAYDMYRQDRESGVKPSPFVLGQSNMIRNAFNGGGWADLNAANDVVAFEHAAVADWHRVLRAAAPRI